MPNVTKRKLPDYLHFDGEPARKLVVYNNECHPKSAVLFGYKGVMRVCPLPKDIRTLRRHWAGVRAQVREDNLPALYRSRRQLKTVNPDFYGV